MDLSQSDLPMDTIEEDILIWKKLEMVLQLYANPIYN